MSVISRRNKKKLAKKISSNPCAYCKHSLLCLGGFLRVAYREQYICLRCAHPMVILDGTYVVVPDDCKLLRGCGLIRSEFRFSAAYDKMWQRTWDSSVKQHQSRYFPRDNEPMSAERALKTARRYFCRDCAPIKADELRRAANNRSKKGARRRVSKAICEAKQRCRRDKHS